MHGHAVPWLPRNCTARNFSLNQGKSPPMRRDCRCTKTCGSFVVYENTKNSFTAWPVEHGSVKGDKCVYMNAPAGFETRVLNGLALFAHELGNMPDPGLSAEPYAPFKPWKPSSSDAHRSIQSGPARRLILRTVHTSDAPQTVGTRLFRCSVKIRE